MSFNKLFFSIILASLFSVSFAMPAFAVGASLYLSPSTGRYEVGNTFSILIKVNSGGVAINAVDTTLIFDPNRLEVKSISKSDSIFTLWIQDPIFSNSEGTVQFAGGKHSPGFTGAAGTIILVTFKAKTAGDANLTFAAGSVLADDGKGTNILTHMAGGSYKLFAREITPSPTKPEKEEEYVPPVTPGRVPVAPVTSSSTHPKENQWYSNDNPEFSWQLPADVTGVSLLLHQNPAADPGPRSDGLMASKKFENIEDGVWYFHIKFSNQYGWGPVTHRKVLIDTQPPEPFKIIFDDKGDPTNPTPTFIFETEDALSGVEYYEVSIDKAAPAAAAAAADIKDNPYQPKPLPPGTHQIEVRAFDKAGNFVSASTQFEILPIKGLKITEIPISIKLGESLKIKGEALPGITVRIYLQKTGQEPVLEKIQADSEGKFTFTYENTLEKGDYLVWAQSEDERGALSYPTQKYSLEVGLPPFLKFGKIAIDYVSIIMTLIVLVAVALAVIFYTWYRISIWRKKVRKETREVGESVSEAFLNLRREIEKQIALLDKKPGLSKSEKELRDKLQEALNLSEKFIHKEIEDIEKEVE